MPLSNENVRKKFRIQTFSDIVGWLTAKWSGRPPLTGSEFLFGAYLLIFCELTLPFNSKFASSEKRKDCSSTSVLVQIHWQNRLRRGKSSSRSSCRLKGLYGWYFKSFFILHHDDLEIPSVFLLAEFTGDACRSPIILILSRSITCFTWYLVAVVLTVVRRSLFGPGPGLLALLRLLTVPRFVYFFSMLPKVFLCGARQFGNFVWNAAIIIGMKLRVFLYL